MESLLNLPLLNMSDYTSESQSDRLQFSKDLVSTLKAHRVAKLVDYGIPASLLQEAFEMSRRFFNLDPQAKLVAAHPAAPNPHRGYSFVGQENTSGLSRRNVEDNTLKAFFDIKETFDQGSAEDELFPNVWPNETDCCGFRQFMERYYQLCRGVHLSLLEALALGLGLEKSCFLTMHEGHASEMRLLHHPKTELGILRADNTMRISEHTDFGSMTLLFQDATGGLEVETSSRDGFQPVDAPLPCMLVILGDSMEHWTNGALRSVWHRVTVPEAFKGSEAATIPERYSFAYFGKPDRTASLRPLSAFATDETPARYVAMTAGEYQQSKLSQTYS